MKEEIENYFQENGYRKYPKTDIFPYAEYFWQKKEVDNFGIKYFIQFIFYSGIGQDKNGAFMAEIVNNGDDKNPHQTYRIHHLNTLDKVIDAEKRISNFFEYFGNYYEIYNK